VEHHRARAALAGLVLVGVAAVTGCSGSHATSVVPSGYSVSGDGATVTLYVTDGVCDTLTASIASQDDQQVRVQATLTWPTPGACPAMARLNSATVTLQQPLGGRTVRDISGATIPSCTAPTSVESYDSTCWDTQPS